MGVLCKTLDLGCGDWGLKCVLLSLGCEGLVVTRKVGSQSCNFVWLACKESVVGWEIAEFRVAKFGA